jgi:hypothetical protein
LLVVLSSASIVILALLSLFVCLAGMRRYIGGDHKRLTI